MAQIDISKAPYYADFDRETMYSEILFNPNRPLQARELTVFQQMLKEDISNLGDSIFKEGDIISGLDFDLKRNTADKTITLNIHSGFVYLDSLPTWTAGETLTLPDNGRVYVNAHIEESIVTSAEDPSLLDPAIGAPSAGAAGGDRLKRLVRFSIFAPTGEDLGNTTEQGAEIYSFQDGSLFVTRTRPGIANIMDILAQRTEETNGSYRVNGLGISVDSVQSNTDSISLSVTDGLAYVRGYRVEKPATSRLTVPTSKDTRTVTNEPALYNSKTQRVPLSSLPVAKVNSVTASVLNKTGVTRTNGLDDPFPDGTTGSGIVAIKSISSPKGVVYGTLDNPATSAHPADFVVKGGNTISWRNGSQVMPTSGTTYQVDYLYTKVMVNGVDYRVTTVDNEFDSHGFKQTYIDFKGFNGAKPSVIPGYSQVNSTYDFYLARRDLISLTATGEFVVIPGEPDLIEKVQIKNGSDQINFPIGWVTVFPNSTDAQSNDYTITNLTFGELQKMQARVSNLERNVAQMAQDVTASLGQDPLTLRGTFSDGLSNLQQSDISIYGEQVLDPDTGEAIADNRWKENGKPVVEVAHNFSNASITLSYKNMVDEGIPDIKSETEPDGTLTQLMRWQGRMVSGNYKNEILISQGIATGTTNVNPYAIYQTQVGSLALDPMIDNFVDITQTTINNVKYKNTKIKRFWNHANDKSRWSQDAQYVYDNLDNISWTNTNAQWIQSGRGKGRPDNATGKSWSGVAKGSIVESGGRQVEESMKQYARSIEVKFEAKGLRPNADNLSVFWDSNGVVASTPLVTKPISPSTTGSAAGTIRADAKGHAKGSFVIPANQPQGNHSIILQNKVEGEPTDKASAVYVSASVNRTIKDIINTTFITAELVDPLGESFRLRGDRVVTGVKLYFSKKSANIPVQVQIRPLADGGLPSSTIIGEKTLDADEIKISDDGSVATTFGFDNPVLCESGKDYAFVVTSNSNDYEVYYAKVGKRKLGTDNSVLVANPYEGVMFSSANAISWTVHQDSDLKFDLLGAQFREGDSTILFDPWVVGNNAKNEKRDIGVLQVPTMTDAEKATIRMEYRVVLESDSPTATIEGAPWQTVDTDVAEIDLGGYIRVIQLRITFKSSKYQSPFISLDTVNLMSLLTDLEGTYVGKTIDMKEQDMFYNTIELSYQENTPQGTQVTPKIAVGQSTTDFIWDTPDQMKGKGAVITSYVSQPNVEGWVNKTYVISFPTTYPNSSALGLQKAKLRLDLSSEVSYIRPQVRQPRLILTDK